MRGAGGRSVHPVRTLAAAFLLGFTAASCSVDPGPPPDDRELPWPDPDPDRPVVRLAYELADGHASVRGREEITFRPDREICEVVLRAWPNKPATAAAGNALEVRSVEVDGAVLPHEVAAAGAPDGAPGTLVEVDLPTCRPAGSDVRVRVQFDLTLAEGTDERLGRDGDAQIAWLGTAYPVLAWQRGEGWVRDEAVDVVGEMATTETFELAELRVDVPEGERVAAVGAVGAVSSAPGGREVHVFTAPALRDVAVTVGDLEVRSVEAAGVRVHLAVPATTRPTLTDRWEQMVTSTLVDLSDMLGPVPYEDVWVSVLPGVSDGVELGAAVQLAELEPGEDDWLVAHELAHLWFHGLVGSNQARDPWLDESLATSAQEAVRPVGWEPPPDALPGRLGDPMTRWGERRRGSDKYVATVYTYGGALLTELRDQAGAGAFDTALRSYLREQAHRVAGPADLRAELVGLPQVDDALAEAGAWDGP